MITSLLKNYFVIRAEWYRKVVYVLLIIENINMLVFTIKMERLRRDEKININWCFNRKCNIGND